MAFDSGGTSETFKSTQGEVVEPYDIDAFKCATVKWLNYSNSGCQNQSRGVSAMINDYISVYKSVECNCD